MATNCAGCGANVSDYDEVCSYCGRNNPAYHSPDHEITIMMSYGIEAFKHEKYAVAIHYFLNVIEVTPELFDAYFYLAACHSALGRPAEAVKAMEQARHIRPGSAPIYFNLGLLYRQIGRKEDAKKYLEQALATAKTDPALHDKQDFESRVKKELAQYRRWKLF